jgi:acyl transferase domain-containing protein
VTTETVFMFSGQGSQYFHMGKALYEGNDTFRMWMRRLDEVARAASGTSVVEALYSAANGKADPFERTALTHPAIYMVEVSLAQTLIESGVVPDMVLGVSVGSFAAAALAGYIDLEDALTAVIRQAKALEESSEPGGMIAILGDPTLFDEEFLGGHSELAGVNFSSHFVISARRTELAAIETELKKRTVSFQRLPVVFPFHSQWMDQAKAPFGAFMQSIRTTAGRLPLACADRTEVLSAVPDGYFWDVVRHPIRFREMVARLERQGDRRYVDVGPAGTLATFLKYLLPKTTNSKIHSILTPFGLDQKNLTSVLASVAN